MFYAAYVFYVSAFMYDRAILWILSPNLGGEIRIIIIIIIIISIYILLFKRKSMF